MAAAIVLGSVSLFSQGSLRPDIRFDNYTGRYGFPRQYMMDVIRDSAGYVWAFGNGLYRFNGMAMTRYANTNNQHHGLKDNYTGHAQVDRWGRMWFAGGGLAWYDLTEDRFRYIQPRGLPAYQYAYAQRVIGHTLWYITQYGLCKLDLRTLQPATTSLTDGFQPWLIHDLGNNELLYATGSNKYYIYHTVADTFAMHDWRINGEFVRIKCAVRAGGQWWLGTSKGVWQTHTMHAPLRPVKGLENLNVKAMTLYPAMGGDSLVWMGTSGNGLTVVDSRTAKIVAQYRHDPGNAFSLSADNINALYVDKDEKLWIAHESGISVLNPDNQLFKTQLLDFRGPGSVDNLVFRIYQDRYDPLAVWMSVAKQGLLRLDWFSKKITGQVRTIGGDSSFYDICQVGKRLWLLNTYSKVFLWHEQKGLQKEIGFAHAARDVQSFNVHTITPYANRFYLSTNHGLYEYTPGQDQMHSVYYRSKDPAISVINKAFVENDMYYGCYDSLRHVVWIASRGGLVAYDPVSGKGRLHYNRSHPDTLNSNALNMASLGPGGTIICCNRTGISIYDPPADRFTQIAAFGTIVNPSCYSSITDGQRIWISSNAGIFSYDFSGKKTDLVNNITPLTEEYSIYPIGRIGNEITFGYRSAYSYFDLSTRWVKAMPSKPVIEKMLVNQQPYYSDGHAIGFPYDQNVISFYFTAFEYNNPEAIRFRYRLADHDQDWTESQGERIAGYSRLPPGHYRFMVQSGSASGGWNPDTAIVEFTIRPPFWQTWWFRLLVLAVIVTVVVVLVRSRIRKIEAKEAEKTQVNKMMADLEMRALRSQMNPHFIFNSLNSIQKYIWENKQEDASEYLTKFSKLIRMILGHSMHKLITLEEELASLQLYVELEHRRCNNKFDYAIQVDDKLALGQILVPPMLMQPYIENAIWHGLLPKEGRGKLRIVVSRRNEHELQYEITDDGIGRKKAKDIQSRKEKAAVSYGMQITRQRLHALEVNGHTGGVIVEDLSEGVEDTGTKVVLTVPAEFFEKLK